MILMILMMTIFAFLPIENLFYSFDNEELLYRYMLKSKPVAVVDGVQSDLMIENNGRSLTSRVIIKKIDGYKITTGLFVKVDNYYDDYLISIIRNEHNDDIYIVVYGLYDELIIQDSLASNFKEYEWDDGYAKQFAYFAFIKEFDSNYELLINGETFNWKG